MCQIYVLRPQRREDRGNTSRRIQMWDWIQDLKSKDSSATMTALMGTARKVIIGVVILEGRCR